MSDPNAAYFAAATPGTAHFVSQDDWEASLFHGLLFQPQLHIIDGGIVAGPYLWDHLYSPIRRGETSWLEEALRTGVLRPHLRRATSLADIVKDLRESRFANVGERASQVAERLDRVEFDPVAWPTDVSIGEGYERLVTSRFSSEVPQHIEILTSSEVGDALIEFWEDATVQRWRTDWIAEAKERTAAHSEQGLRYSDIVCVAYEAIARKPSFPGVTVNDILEAVPTHEPILAAKLRIYFKILCEFHGYNFAGAIGCRPGLVNVDALTAAIVLPAREGAEPPEDMEELGTVRLPSLRQFRRTAGAALTFLRDTDEAHSFFGSLDEWLKAPTEETRSQLVTDLKTYADKICKSLELDSAPVSHVMTDAVSNVFIGGGATAILAMAFQASVPETVAFSVLGSLTSALAPGLRAALGREGTSSVSVIADRSVLPVCRDLSLGHLESSSESDTINGSR